MVSDTERDKDDLDDRSAAPHQADERMLQLAIALAESRTVVATVHEVVRFAVESTGTAYGGVTLLQAGGRRFESVGATDPSVEEADRLQYDLNEGPCVDAAVKVKSLHSESLKADARWPRWGPAASELGFHSIISAEIHGRGQRIGALNLYGLEETQFDAEDIDVARLFAAQAGVALANIRNELGLIEALDTRTMIGQAQGILMERYDLDAVQAFDVLRRYSQESNRRIRDIVAELVETRELPGAPRHLDI
jgi:GAF domain-containing protein